MIKFFRKKLKGNRGFTLVELLVVLAVLAIISAIAVPRFAGVQKAAKESADYATGEMIARAADIYISVNNLGDSGTIALNSLTTDGQYLEEKKVKIQSQGIEIEKTNTGTGDKYNLVITYTSYSVSSIVVNDSTGKLVMKIYPRP